MMSYKLGNYIKPDLPPIIDHVSGDLVQPQLTDHEARIIAMLCDGLTRQEIAESLDRSPETVKNLILSASKKVGEPSSLKLALWYINYHLLERFQLTIAQLITIDGG